MEGVERLAAAVEGAVADQDGWEAKLSAGLSAGLDFLAADPPLAHLLLVEVLAIARPAHERTLARLARALQPPASKLRPGEALSAETALMLAGGLASYLSGRVLAGEAELLPQSRELLLEYLLMPSVAE